MADHLALTRIALLALIGASAGIHLGRSAVAEINPIHFAGAGSQSSAYAVGTADRRIKPAPASLALDEGGVRSNCVGCRTYPEEYYPVRDASVKEIDEGGWSPASSVADTGVIPDLAETLAELARRKATLQRLERYDRAPVTADDQPALAAPSPAVPRESKAEEGVEPVPRPEEKSLPPNE